MTWLIQLLLIIPVILIVLTTYSFVKAWLVYTLGDKSVEDRLTLNPMAHFDTIGLIIMVLVAVISGFRFIVGWPKPIDYSTYWFREPLRDELIVNLGAILSLFLLAYLSYKLSLILPPAPGLVFSLMSNTALWFTIWFSLPVRPMEGEKVIRLLLPANKRYDWDSFQDKYSFILFIILVIAITVYPYPFLMIYGLLRGLIELF